MDKVTQALHHWLAKHNIPADGVKIVVEFPNIALARHAEQAIKLDLEPMLMSYTQLTFGQVETMNGIGLSLRAASVKAGDAR